MHLALGATFQQQCQPPLAAASPASSTTILQRRRCCIAPDQTQMHTACQSALVGSGQPGRRHHHGTASSGEQPSALPQRHARCSTVQPGGTPGIYSESLQPPARRASPASAMRWRRRRQCTASQFRVRGRHCGYTQRSCGEGLSPTHQLLPHPVLSSGIIQ